MASGFSGTRFGDLHKGNWIGGEIADKSVDPHSKNVPEQIYASARMFGKTGARCFSLIDQLFYAEQQRFAEDKPTPLSVQNVGTIPISRVTADLSPGEATLEYVLPEKGNAYCIFLSHNSVSIIRLGPAAQLAALARTFVDDLARNKPWKENSQAQYAAVLTPIPNIDQFNRLTIVPDGDLHLVPFDALSSPSGKLLGETAVYGLCTIGCEWSSAEGSTGFANAGCFSGVGGAIYNQTGMQPFTLAKAKKRGGYLGVDPAKLPNLPESGEEVESAADLLHAPPKLRTLQIGKNATESSFRICLSSHKKR